MHKCPLEQMVIDSENDWFVMRSFAWQRVPDSDPRASRRPTDIMYDYEYPRGVRMWLMATVSYTTSESDDIASRAELAAKYPEIDRDDHK
jgi:hypothetical protein